MTTTTTLPALVESETVRADYDMPQTMAIIDTAEGRIFISECFGGVNQSGGGTIRWRHGIACRLRPNDTLASLRAGEHNETTSTFAAMVHGCDEDRPILPWRGSQIRRLAERVGLA